MSQKRALILGINGQDGSYLADILLEKGYDVHGVVRRNSQPNLWRLSHCLDQITFHQGDLLDPISIQEVFYKVAPEEVYNEADQDHVGYSTTTPSYSAQVTYGAVANLLEMIRPYKRVRFFQPVSATMFGDTPGPQNEETPFDPHSPYAISKLAAYHLCALYRKQHGVFASTAILYNHDSVRRQGDYLLHKICKSAVMIAHHDQENLTLSNQWMKVDIGCPKEYMEAAWKMLQLESPTDLVIGSGTSTSIYSLVRAAFLRTGARIEQFKEVPGKSTCTLESDISKARELIGFNPQRNVFMILNELCDHYTDTLYRGK